MQLQGKQTDYAYIEQKNYGRAVVVTQVVAHLWIKSSIPTRGWDFLSSLSYISISDATLIWSLMEVQRHWFSTFQQKNRGLAVHLEAKQA